MSIYAQYKCCCWSSLTTSEQHVSYDRPLLYISTANMSISNKWDDLFCGNIRGVQVNKSDELLS